MDQKTKGQYFPRLFLTLCGSRTAIFPDGVIYLYLSAHSSWRQHQRGCVSRWGDVDASGRSHARLRFSHGLNTDLRVLKNRLLQGPHKSLNNLLLVWFVHGIKLNYHDSGLRRTARESVSPFSAAMHNLSLFWITTDNTYENVPREVRNIFLLL